MAAALCKKHGKAWGLPCGDYAAVELYSRYENGFAPKFYTKNHHFSKTGSGQTQKNLKKKTALFFSCSMGAQLLSMGGEFVSVMNTWQVRKTALFAPFIYKMHYFTKTGSGQT
jgi:hypothetical protein